MDTARYNLMKVLSEKQVLENRNSDWYLKTIQKAKYDKMEILIETVEKI